MSKEENKYLAVIGLTFPTCEEELFTYEKNHVDIVYELGEEAIDPNKILREVNESLSPKKKVLNRSQSYFRRTVLAAKIAHEYHEEPTFGIVKFQKLVYLSEQISDMKFTSDYRKQAAGPMDHRFKHSIKNEFEKQGWFAVKQVGDYKKWVFTPQENLIGYQPYYQNYYENVSDDIQFLIEIFRKWKTDQVELVATLFDCVLEAKQEKSIISDQLLIQKLYAWNKSKKKFSENEILESIRWMEENGVYPS